MRRPPSTVALAVACVLAAGASALLPSAADAAAGVSRLPASSSTAAAVRAQRDALLLQIGSLTDRLEGAQAQVVADEMRQQAAARTLALAQASVRSRAVAAYVYGTSRPTSHTGASSVYLAAALRKERGDLAAARAAGTAADRLRISSEQTRDALRVDAAALDAARQQLDALVAVDDAQRAEIQRQSDEARARANAATSASVAASRGRALVAIPSGRGYAPSPLDPSALTPRHRAATAAQLALMARYPFGPVTPGTVPAGLAATGQTLAGLASWYGPGFNGRATASGAIYDEEAWTAASRDLPLGTMLIVSRGDRSVLLLVNDRGPYVYDRILDLSHGVATYLGVGMSPVTAVVVAPL